MEAEPESKMVKRFKTLYRNLTSQNSPMLDLLLLTLLTLGLTAAGFTYQNIFEIRQLALSYRNVLSGYSEAQQKNPHLGEFSKQRPLEDIHTSAEMWHFLKNEIPRSLIAEKEYNGEPVRKQGMIIGSHMVVQKFRLRQVRVKPERCKFTGDRVGVTKTQVEPGGGVYTAQGSLDGTCYPKYSIWVEDMTTWNNVSYQPGVVLKVKERLTYNNPYRAGGFVEAIPSHDFALWVEKVASLEAGGWVDSATRAVFLEFVSFVTSLDLFMAVSVMFEISEHGTVRTTIFITPFRDQLTKASGGSSSNGTELLLYAIAFANLLREFGKMWAFGLPTYWSKVWNIISIFALIMCFVSAYHRLLISGQWGIIQGYDKNPWSLEAETGQWNVLGDWANIGYNYQQLIKYQALALVGTWLRSFGYLQFFNRRVDDFVSSMVFARGPLLVFIITVSALLIGIALGFHTGYGVADHNFQTFGSSLLTLMEMMFGNYDPAALDVANGVLISGLMVVTLSIMSIYTLAMALAMLSWANRQVVLGLVLRASDDTAKNVKNRVLRLLGWALSPLGFILGHQFIKTLSNANDLKAAVMVLNEDEKEAERALSMQSSWMQKVKTGLKTLIRSAAVLRSRIRTLEGEYGVIIESSEPEFKRNNVWRKLRNQFQERAFQNMLHMVRVGNVASLRECLAAWKNEDWGCDLEWRDADGFTALHTAAFAGDTETVQALLAFKCDANAQNDDGNTPLHLSAMTGQINACRILVEEGKCVANPMNMFSFTPVHLAAYTGHQEVLKVLVDDCRGDVFAQNDDGLTCLHCAVMQSNTGLVRYIAGRWPDITEVQANGGETALHAAIATNQPIELIRALLQCGAKVGARNYEGANAHEISEEVESPLAVQRLLYYVLRAGDDYVRASSTLDEGATTIALIQFAAAGKLAEMQELFDAGCDVDSVQPGGGTALHAAVRRRKGQVMSVLLGAGANPLMEDSAGMTPLMLAIAEGYFEGYKLLMDSVREQDRQAVDENGDTFLHHASRAGRSLEIAEHMVAVLRIDPLTCNYEGVTSVDCAEQALMQLRQMDDRGVMSQARLGDNGLEAILELFNDRDAWEDDEMAFKLQAARRVREQDNFMYLPGMAAEDSTQASRDENHLYSMKVRKFFEGLGFKKFGKEYAMLFKENEIEFDLLHHVTDAQLKEMGIVVIGTRNKILAGIKSLATQRGNSRFRRPEISLGNTLDEEEERPEGSLVSKATPSAAAAKEPAKMKAVANAFRASLAMRRGSGRAADSTLRGSGRAADSTLQEG